MQSSAVPQSTLNTIQLIAYEFVTREEGGVGMKDFEVMQKTAIEEQCGECY